MEGYAAFFVFVTEAVFSLWVYFSFFFLLLFQNKNVTLHRISEMSAFAEKGIYIMFFKKKGTR